ncbi:MAG: hypothetical protein K6F32_00365, partial [Bacilli bacterium]|nr:hypothetical protein [Bacilli bacterium]
MILNYWFLENSIFSSYFVPLYIGLVFEIWASSLILLIPFRRKSFWGLRIAANSLAMIGIAIGLGYLRNVASDSLALRIGCSLIIYSSLLGALFLTFDEKPIDIFLVWVSILAIREAADGEDTLIKLIFQVPLRTMGYIEGGGFFVNGLIFDAVHLFVQLPLGFIFSKYASRTNDKTIIMRTAVLSVSIVFTCIIIKAVVVSYSSESIALYGAAVALTYLLSLLCLILRTDVLTGSQKTREIETMNAVLDAQQKQFEDSKQSIALINAKV